MASSAARDRHFGDVHGPETKAITRSFGPHLGCLFRGMHRIVRQHLRYSAYFRTQPYEADIETINEGTSPSSCGSQFVIQSDFNPNL